MCKLNYDMQSFDLIWCERAIFIIGFEKGLREWRPLIVNKWYLVVSEMTWLRDDRPKEITEFMQREYPAIMDIQGNNEVA